jgi:RNA polymerase sigma factor (sigma-70 family)
MTQGRQDRLIEWCRELGAPLRRFLGSQRGVARADLDDVAQEVFLRLLRFDRAELIAQPKAYLFKMAANVASEWAMRARQRRPHASEWLSELTTESQLDEELQRETREADVARAINALPPRTRTILRLHFDEELTHEAIAERLNVTRRVVKREIIHAYVLLRGSLSDENPQNTGRANKRVLDSRGAP